MLIRPALAIALAAGALALGTALLIDGLSGDRGEDVSAPQPVTGRRDAATPGADRDAATRAVLRNRLEAGVERAAELGARVQAAVWVDDWDSPVTAGAGLELEMRLWSMSKPFAAIAVLEAIEPPGPAWLTRALDALLLRSENCPMRALMLELQRRAGSVEAARRALAAVFRAGGAPGVKVAERVEAPDPECLRRLRADGVPEPEAEALLTGTSTWTIADAVRMTHALADGRFGIPGDLVLALMRRPKAPSTEIGSPDDYTVDPDWGAGRVFAEWTPAYKAGWGGANHGNFMVGQLIVLTRGSRNVAIAVMAHPDSQPPIDDPGRTRAPAALEAVLRAIEPSLRDLVDRGRVPGPAAVTR